MTIAHAGHPRSDGEAQPRSDLRLRFPNPHRTLMPGLSRDAQYARLATAAEPCYVCADPIEPEKDLIVTVRFRRYTVHRAHLDEARVVELLGQATT